MPAESFNESAKFIKKYKRIDTSVQVKIIKLIRKIMETPDIGKPMRYVRKGTREVYMKPFRLSYAYDQKKQKIFLLDLYHKKKQ